MSRPTLPDPDALGVDRTMLDRAVGGWRGLIDTGLPATVFILAYALTGQQLRPSVTAAVGTGAIIALWRLARREPLQQVAAGFLGVAVSAFVATRTGRAQDYFLIGILINIAYLAVYVVSILVRWPLIGLLVGYLRGDATGWRSDPVQVRAYATASWLWAAMFGIRLAVQLPLYLAGAVGALGVAKLVMGWPLFLLTAYLTYRIIHPIIAAQVEPALEAEAEA